MADCAYARMGRWLRAGRPVHHNTLKNNRHQPAANPWLHEFSPPWAPLNARAAEETTKPLSLPGCLPEGRPGLP